MKYLNYVHVTQGTNSVPEFSHGNILPLTSVPFGMANFAIETRRASLFFNPNDTFTTGIRLTHMPSPWINDYGTFTVSAATGDANGAAIDGRQRSAYTLRRTVYTPAEIDMELMVHRARLHLVPTTRCGLLEMSWEEPEKTHRFVMTHGDAEIMMKVDAAARRVTGYTRTHTWPAKDNFALYFALDFDRDFDLSKSTVGVPGQAPLDIGAVNTAKRLALNLAFVNDGSAKVSCRIGTSFISVEQAVTNLETELVGKDFDTLLHDAEEAWEEKLSRIEIEADEKTMHTFYSCLYRMFLFPRIFHEYDKEGNQKHYSPSTGEICDGPFYTDNGFWDTYKTVYPMYSLINSDGYTDMCRGFLNFYDEAGWLPRWMSPGAVNCMPGTAIDAVFGDAVEKGVVTDKKMIEKMFESTMKHVLNPAPAAEYGRDGVEGFNTLGYVTSDHRESVNKTQDYAYGNFCIAKLAKALGKEKEYAELMKTSLNYRNLWDNEVGFMRARDKDGNRRADWNPFQWGGDYTEGSSWQNSFALFHDYLGLAKIMGGKDKLIAKLDDLFSTKPYYDVYGYGFEIHEMIEMAAVDFGQFAISNQPSFHLPYIYAMLGKPEKTAYWTRRAMKELFNETPNGYPGDEDNGSMAGWFVFSALGFYPVCPGAAEYVVGSPAVRSAVIHTDSGKDLVIRADNNTAETVYVKNIKVNGETIHRTFFTQEELKAGGVIEFKMSKEPVPGSYIDAELPYSVEH
ncbi:MAG: GH92 family glycosyl hydrolase [Lachnospiraceae bacterium]|nr:GH92 family glycosyl hydrolase [Lachnospiraceae bacterium]